MTEHEHQFSDFYRIPLDKFFQFGISVDCVIFGYTNGQLEVLLIERGIEPYAGVAAIPGDLVYPNEDIEKAASRIAESLTGLSHLCLHQNKVYGEVDRHPVGRVVTCGYFSVVEKSHTSAKAQSWAGKVIWADVNKLPGLAFDHNQIINDAFRNLKRDIKSTTLIFEMLEEKFTINSIQNILETILSQKYDKANFRKRLLAGGFLVDTGEFDTSAPHRPPRLYTLDQEKLNTLFDSGYQLVI